MLYWRAAIFPSRGSFTIVIWLNTSAKVPKHRF